MELLKKAEVLKMIQKGYKAEAEQHENNIKALKALENAIQSVSPGTLEYSDYTRAKAKAAEKIGVSGAVCRMYFKIIQNLEKMESVKFSEKNGIPAKMIIIEYIK